MAVPERRRLAFMEGSELGSIVFVRDYIQFVFEAEAESNSTLTTFTLPTVTRGDMELGPLAQGYRDALCSLIGLRVVSAEAEEGVEVLITLGPRLSLRVSLREEDYRGPEAVLLVTGNGEMEVW
jgi:hypothetical protein